MKISSIRVIASVGIVFWALSALANDGITIVPGKPEIVPKKQQTPKQKADQTNMGALINGLKDPGTRLLFASLIQNSRDVAAHSEAKERAEQALRDNPGASHSVAAVLSNKEFTLPQGEPGDVSGWMAIMREYRTTDAAIAANEYDAMSTVYGKGYAEIRPADSSSTLVSAENSEYIDRAYISTRDENGNITTSQVTTNQLAQHYIESEKRRAEEEAKRAEEAKDKAEADKAKAKAAQAKANAEALKREYEQKEAECKKGAASCALANDRFMNKFDTVDRLNRTALCMDPEAANANINRGPCAPGAPPCPYCSTTNAIKSSVALKEKVQTNINKNSLSKPSKILPKKKQAAPIQLPWQ